MNSPETLKLSTEAGESLRRKTIAFVRQLPLAEKYGIGFIDMQAIIRAFESGKQLPKDIVQNLTSGFVIDPQTMEKASRAFLKEYYEAPVEDLNLSVRVWNVLRRRGIETVGQILENGEFELNNADLYSRRAGRKIRGLGKVGIGELKESLSEYGIWPFNQAVAEKHWFGASETISWRKPYRDIKITEKNYPDL